MTYEAWRISYQSSEQAAKAAYALAQQLQDQIDAIGAGGVESLRKCAKLVQIQEPVSGEWSREVVQGNLVVCHPCGDSYEVPLSVLAAAPKPPEAAPVLLPDSRGRVMIDEDGECEIAWRGGMPPDNGTNIYTEQQVRQLLAAQEQGK